MSIWYEVEDPECVDVGIKHNTLDILYSSDDHGNNYVSAPIKIVIDTLRKAGYKIEEPSDEQ